MADVDVWQAARQGLLEDVQVCPDGVFSSAVYFCPDVVPPADPARDWGSGGRYIRGSATWAHASKEYFCNRKPIHLIHKLV